jgi:hypothetical protein
MQCVSEIIERSGEEASVVMRRYVGDVIQTKHANGIREYRVTVVTPIPLKYLMVYKEFMSQYYMRRYGKELQYSDFPCFVTESTNLIPPELAYVNDDFEMHSE